MIPDMPRVQVEKVRGWHRAVSRMQQWARMWQSMSVSTQLVWVVCG